MEERTGMRMGPDDVFEFAQVAGKLRVKFRHSSVLLAGLGE